ncbi:unnamed protein product [Nesidiocoris tenuis]|uniref:Vacuolar protein sorting-associated protein 54 C-terminal domain-containing protein n=1 Tax=Nesidiocoris tenuis TaxID=355587 RepID=A0A6H5GNL6_9HEMI|nr:unnamed protein product [Nesidiocoris tenuis]
MRAQRASRSLHLFKECVKEQLAATSCTDCMTGGTILKFSGVLYFWNKISKIEKDVVNNSLLVLKSERSRCNRQLVYDKLKIMATVMHTQSTIQLLLSNRDYVGALDLIQATEILLVQELTGVHSFRCKDDNSRTNNHWWMERATLKQLKDLAKLVGEMNSSWDALCPTASIHSYKSAFSHQCFPVPHRLSFRDFSPLRTVLMLVNMVAEYCFHAEEIPVCAEALLRYVSDLLVQFNSKCYKLILGGEALSEKTGLQKITSTNMALLLRALHLVLWLIPHVRVHFQGSAIFITQFFPLFPLNSAENNATNLFLAGLIGESFKDQLEEVTIHIKNHAVGIMNKLTGIMKNLISSELRNWDAKPPVPSKPFQNICGHLKRLSEAVTNILPHDQVQELYKEVNISFKELFSDKLHKMNLTNDGGVTHGLVSTELIFYLEGLRRVDALPAASLELSAMNDIWTMRSS